MNEKCFSKSTTVFEEFINNIDQTLFKNLLKELPNEEGRISLKKKVIYKNGLAIESAYFNIVFLINKGEWFKETMRFTVYLDESIDFILVGEGFKEEKKLFKKNNISNISDFIANTIKEKRALNNIINIKGINKEG